MGAKQSIQKSLYHYVIDADIASIQTLSRQGASLEWKDKEGKTPLIVASENERLYGVAKTLIELGANVNAFSKGPEKGTALHYAAKAGLHQHVALLLSQGANPFVKNVKHQTPLDVARKNQRPAVVREIEAHIRYYSGEIKEVYGPGFSDSSAPHLSSRLIWVVIVPRTSQNPPTPPTLELVIYLSSQDAEPRKIVSLKRCKIKGPKFDQPSPALIIFDKHSKTRYKFTSVTEGNKQQLRQLYNACKGISQVMAGSGSSSSSAWKSPEPMTSPLKLSLHPGSISPCMTPRGNIWMTSPTALPQNHWSVAQPQCSPHSHEPAIGSPAHQAVDKFPAAVWAAPSAPPMNPENEANLCVICWEVPVEGACVPCGHVAGCMPCLNQVKVNTGFCPVCRSHIDQVIKLYTTYN